MRPIVGLVSSYREGPLIRACVESLSEACDRVFVLDGPVGEPHEEGEPSRLNKPPGNVTVWVRTDGISWPFDAAKRTELLRRAQQRVPGEAWAVILDGDEVLMNPRLLPDVLWRAGYEENEGGVTLRLVEAGDDPVVYETGARCLPLHLLERYVLSSHIIALRSGVEVSLPLLPATRPPAFHEPHIVHRSYLRPPRRNAPDLRLSSDELERLRKLGMAI